MAAAPLSDAKLRRLRALQTRAMREKYREFIVEGRRVVDEALRSDWDVDCIIVSQSGRRHLEHLNAIDHSIYVSDDDIFGTISTTEHSQGIIAVVREKEVCIPATVQGVILALDRIADPGNVGTIIRTADWFGVSAVVLGLGCAELFNPKTVRSTMGSAFHLPVVSHVDLREFCAEFKAREFQLWCADASGKKVDSSHAVTANAVLVIGSEAHGVDPALLKNADACLAVEGAGRAESLNAASATAALLALLQAFRQG